jgi:hypothetical protein
MHCLSYACLLTALLPSCQLKLYFRPLSLTGRAVHPQQTLPQCRGCCAVLQCCLRCGCRERTSPLTRGTCRKCWCRPHAASLARSRRCSLFHQAECKAAGYKDSGYGGQQWQGAKISWC